MHKPLLTRTGTVVCLFFFLGVKSQNLAAVFEHPQMLLILNSVSAQSQKDYLLDDYFRQHLA